MKLKNTPKKHKLLLHPAILLRMKKIIKNNPLKPLKHGFNCTMDEYEYIGSKYLFGIV